VGDLINKFFVFDTHQNAKGNTIFDSTEVRCPVWAFVEIISFGDLVKLFDFYYENDSPIKVSLNPVKSLRNACAHNNCLINNLRSGQSRPGRLVNTFVSQIPGISKDVRKKYLSVRPIFEFINLLIVYDKVVSSTIKSHRYEELKKLVAERIPKHAEYYQKQQLLKASYDFIKKVVDFLA
jgi:abortive infection bacteriophage resistance protein